MEAGDNIWNELFDGDYTKVLELRIWCTVCKCELNDKTVEKWNPVFTHSELNVLLCELCWTRRKSIRSPKELGMCMWCGPKSNQSEKVTCCSCDEIFCITCLELNFGTCTYGEAKLKNNLSLWQCFVCAEKKEYKFLKTICLALKCCMPTVINNTDATRITVQEESIINSNNDDISGKEHICAICMNDELRECIQIINCGHLFHTDCFKKWIQKKKSCPMCRSTDVKGVVFGDR